MGVFLAGAGSIVVDAAEEVAETSSRSRRKSSETAAHSLPVRAASTNGACRLVGQRSIRMPHFVCLGAGGGLRVCYPWSLMPKVLVAVEGNDGGGKEVCTGVHRFALPIPHESVPILPNEKKKRKTLISLMSTIRYVDS